MPKKLLAVMPLGSSAAAFVPLTPAIPTNSVQFLKLTVKSADPLASAGPVTPAKLAATNAVRTNQLPIELWVRCTTIEHTFAAVIVSLLDSQVDWVLRRG
ncbi:MAG: hypothetical protein EXR39_07640 [Betaproteobacteria bacterium]|nr:hypothetical protein [Betaproteobacteria bacterium]